MLAPGSGASAENAVDINVFHGAHGHFNELLLLRETVKILCVELLGTLRPCPGCSMAKAYRKPIPNSTKSRASERIGRVFVDLSGRKRTPSLLGKRYIVLEKEKIIFISLRVCVLSKERTNRMQQMRLEIFRLMRAPTVCPLVFSKAEIVRSDNGGECFDGG